MKDISTSTAIKKFFLFKRNNGFYYIGWNEDKRDSSKECGQGAEEKSVILRAGFVDKKNPRWKPGIMEDGKRIE